MDPPARWVVHGAMIRTPLQAIRTSSGPAAILLLGMGIAACDIGTAPPVDRVSPLEGAALLVPYPSPASRQVDAWRDSRPADAAAIQRIAEQPRAVWLTDGDPAPEIESALHAADTTGTLAVFALYYIPERDCGPEGAPDADAYRDWVRTVSAALRGRRSVVILEPDALAASDCPGVDGGARLALLAKAVTELKSAGAVVYIDAGHPRWQPVRVTAERLRLAGIDGADGFALNVANFVSTTENVEYGRAVQRLVGGVGFVIDTGRNGAGPAPDGEWCNPPGRKLGSPPTTSPPYGAVDALLWIKRPGESDGTCNGGPPAGEWWPEYALDLAR